MPRSGDHDDLCVGMVSLENSQGSIGILGSSRANGSNPVFYMYNAVAVGCLDFVCDDPSHSNENDSNDNKD
jgi:hypothetical protein